jgi:exonuclease SbcD
VPRRLATVRGQLEELLSGPEYDELAECYLSVTLTDQVRPVDAMRKLRERFAYAVHLDWQPEGAGAGAALRYAETVRGRSDIEIARSFLNDCRGAPPNDREAGLIQKALVAAGRVAA